MRLSREQRVDLNIWDHEYRSWRWKAVVGRACVLVVTLAVLVVSWWGLMHLVFAPWGHLP